MEDGARPDGGGWERCPGSRGIVQVVGVTAARGLGAVVAVEVLGEEVEASMRTSRPARKFRLVTKISQSTTLVTQDMQHNDELTRR